jgi:hypothetical protein
LGWIKVPPVAIVHRKEECRTPKPRPKTYFIETDVEPRKNLELVPGTFRALNNLGGDFQNLIVRDWLIFYRLPGYYQLPGFGKDGHNFTVFWAWNIWILNCQGEKTHVHNINNLVKVSGKDGGFWMQNTRPIERTRRYYEDLYTGSQLEYRLRDAFWSKDSHSFLDESHYFDFESNNSYVTLPECYLTIAFDKPYEKLPFNLYCPTEPPNLKELPTKEEDECCMSCCNNAGLIKLLIAKVDALTEITNEKLGEYPLTSSDDTINNIAEGLVELLNKSNESVDLTEIDNKLDTISTDVTELVNRDSSDLTEINNKLDTISTDVTELVDSEQWEMDLLEVKTKLDQITDSIGVENYPQVLPSSFLASNEADENPIGSVSIPNLTELIKWFADRYKDTIVDYLGYEHQEVVKKMPLSFDPGQEDFSKLLKEKEIEVKVLELVDNSTLKTNILDLLQAAAIIRAVHWRKIDPKGDITQQIKDYLLNQRDAGKAINNQEDFDTFLEDVEMGFINEVGNTNKKPYGRELDERPRIRKIGDNQA